jgi:hypothetical protein
MLFNSKYCLGLLCFLWWSQEPGWEALGPVIGWEALSLFTQGIKDNVPSNNFPGKWDRSQRWLPPAPLPPKMACLSTLKTSNWVWTLSWGNLSECCNQSLLTFILFLFLLQVLFFSFYVPIIVYGCGYMDQLI